MRLKDALIATRPWSFKLTFISITTGAILASRIGRFSYWIYLCCLFGAIFLHAAANTLNDYCDTKNHVDALESPTALYRPHPIFCGTTDLKGLLIFSVSLFAVALIMAAILILCGSKWLWLIILSGIFLAIFYTANPFGLKYIALGELAVFLVFGPLMIEGSYAAQAFQLSTKTFLISISFGLLVSLVLLSNNIRDLEFDARLKIAPTRSKAQNFFRLLSVKTLPIILGKKNSLNLFLGITAIVFTLIIVYVFCGILKWPALIVFISISFFEKLISCFFKQIPASADVQTSQVTFLFGSLLLAALLSEKFLPHM